MDYNRVFIDTAAWVAFIDKNDQFHHEAAHHFKSIFLKKDLLYTSNLVIYETLTLLAYKVSHHIAVNFINTVSADQFEWCCSRR